jgi:hypothetical protein
MSNTKHTPGPWAVDGAFGDYIVGDHSHAGMHGALQAPVANLRNCANIEANARLIAAAPDLLEALQALLRSQFVNVGSGRALNVSDSDVAIARAALAKAGAL